MYLEKFRNHPNPMQVKKQIENDILENDGKDMEDHLDDYKPEKNENNHFNFQPTKELLNEVSSDDLYSWYSTAIQRREGRKPLSEDSFKCHFFEREGFNETFSYGDSEKGYLLGFQKFGVFIPSHFAPKTLRGGYELLKALGDSDTIPSILAITEDLAETLKKMPSWHKIEIGKDVLSYFRGELVKKDIYYNSHPEVQNLMMGLMLEYLNQSHEQRRFTNNSDIEDEDDLNDEE
ncbi:MAG: hypothetical protein WCT50_02710 [Patescibacteria group bacterium]